VTRSPTAHRRSWVEQIMGLPVSVLARGEGASATVADAAVRAVFDELHRVDALFSLYRPDSEVSRLGRGELRLEDAHPDLRDVFARCDRARTSTGGLFDATRPGGLWDPSGLVKGWAAERAFRHLAAVPGPDWCLNAGGDVVLACPSGDPFGVGIQDPRDPARLATVVRRTGGAVATSGTAARGAHLYDPRTGAAAGRWASVTVTGPSLETADVLATAAFVAGDAWADVIDTAPEYSGLAIDPGGALLGTATWPGRAAG
jgi:thiamine biosynthesis lipoprotein